MQRFSRPINFRLPWNSDSGRSGRRCKLEKVRWKTVSSDKRNSDKDFCLKGKSHVISLYLARHLAPRIKKLARKIEGDKGLWKRAKDKGEHDEIDKKSWLGWFIRNRFCIFPPIFEMFQTNDYEKRWFDERDSLLNVCELTLITIWRSCNTIIMRNIRSLFR